MRNHRTATMVAALTAGVALSGCGGSDTSAPSTVGPPAPATASARESVSGSSGSLPQGDESVTLDPADFTTEIDNPYWPMSPGSRWVFIEGDPEGTREDVVVEVTDRTKMIANGVEARVVIDTVSANGVPVEITEDWYAQDEVGNIWYLGEYVTNYVDGVVVDHSGSFEAGVDGAQAGIAVLRPGRRSAAEHAHRRPRRPNCTRQPHARKVEGHLSERVRPRTSLPVSDRHRP